MLIQFQHQLKILIQKTLKERFFQESPMPEVELEVPTAKEFGDYSINIAMQAARILKRAPIQIANDFCPVIDEAIKGSEISGLVESVSPAAPGFINFKLSQAAVYQVLYDIFTRGNGYGSSIIGQGKKVLIEFVSSNPTGPLTIAHARQAAVGDVLANLLNFCGFDAKREYYVNDGGNQVVMLGLSIEYRIKEILGEKIDFPENCYQGAYIKGMAKIFMENHKIRTADDLSNLPNKTLELQNFGVTYLMDVIREELNDFGVLFDIWSYESRVSNHQAVEEALKELDAKGFLFEKDGALWFRSTNFGDDKDRVVRKSDGNYTYLAPDIAYHKNKYERGFDRVYNIWGPDHHGYIPRIKAAVQALGHNVDDLEVLIVQLATIYRNGQPVSMSTRKGEFISLREVLTEVGKDASRFFFLMRCISAHLDFDLDLAKKETPENPVYYIQYAHARIHSIIEKARESNFFAKTEDLHLLKESEEIDLIKKIGDFQEVVEQCAKEMEPFPLLIYLQETATCFHRFYDRHRVVDLAEPALSFERLGLINGVMIVLANGLRLLGISTPERM
ncbi:MAG: arginine--tRNA ligase [Candidatus Omnitrophota bacterium]